MCEICVLNFECLPECLQFTVSEQNTRYCTYSLDTLGQCSIYTRSTFSSCLNGRIKSLIVTSCLVFCSFCHSFSQCLKMLKLPGCTRRAVINAKESDSCQTACVMASVKSSLALAYSRQHCLTHFRSVSFCVFSFVISVLTVFFSVVLNGRE